MRLSRKLGRTRKGKRVNSNRMKSRSDENRDSVLEPRWLRKSNWRSKRGYATLLLMKLSKGLRRRPKRTSNSVNHLFWVYSPASLEGLNLR